MTLDIVAVRGQSTWWAWMIRNQSGGVVEESRMQFRSAAAAQRDGHARLADLVQHASPDTSQ